MIKRVQAICFLLAVLLPSLSFVFNEGVHRRMSRSAYDQSVLASGTGDYLSTIGLAVQQPINGRFAKAWIEEGGWREDVPEIRAWNHFYDPTTGKIGGRSDLFN